MLWGQSTRANAFLGSVTLHDCICLHLTMPVLIQHKVSIDLVFQQEIVLIVRGTLGSYWEKLTAGKIGGQWRRQHGCDWGRVRMSSASVREGEQEESLWLGSASTLYLVLPCSPARVAACPRGLGPTLWKCIRVSIETVWKVALEGKCEQALGLCPS